MNKGEIMKIMQDEYFKVKGQEINRPDEIQQEIQEIKKLPDRLSITSVFRRKRAK